MKKFVAFQEGFERLFDIMSSEGMLEGGSVIVKDCLLVCTNLLAGSSLTKVGWLSSVGCSRGAVIERFRGAVVDHFIDALIAARGMGRSLCWFRCEYRYTKPMQQWMQQWCTHFKI